jgi:predicted O-methyltransferase YrrM
MIRGGAALHCFKYAIGLEPAATQTTATERDLLARYAKRASRLLEIGVYEGFTTRTIAEAMPATAVLYAVDPFFKGRLGICWGELISHWEVSKIKNKAVKFVRTTSAEAATRISGQFDFIFIDADHSLSGITTDWEKWSSRCAVGGVMAFHDTRIASHAPQVQEFGSFQFYNSHIVQNPDFQEIDTADTLSIIRRLR